MLNGKRAEKLCHFRINTRGRRIQSRDVGSPWKHVGNVNAEEREQNSHKHGQAKQARALTECTKVNTLLKKSIRAT